MWKSSSVAYINASLSTHTYRATSWHILSIQFLILPLTPAVWHCKPRSLVWFFRDELQMSQQAKIKGRVTAGGMIINRCGVSREHKPLSCSLVLLIKTYSLSLPSDRLLSTCGGRQTCTPGGDLVTRHRGRTAGVLGKIHSSFLDIRNLPVINFSPWDWNLGWMRTSVLEPYCFGGVLLLMQG